MPFSSSVQRLASTRITTQIEIVDEIVERFGQLDNSASEIPTLEEDSDGSRIVAFEGTTDLYLTAPSGQDITHVFLSYLAPYAPQLTVEFVGHSPGALCVGSQWDISKNGPLLTIRNIDGDEEHYSTAAIRRRTPEIAGEDLTDLWPARTPTSDR